MPVGTLIDVTYKEHKFFFLKKNHNQNRLDLRFCGFGGVLVAERVEFGQGK